ncbi:MAG: biotin/lipoyl-binding protein [Hyphomicrobium aestuarii]|nr:biotin/lipoyl-binding protein [Hyphomicrobium aestuarii]
MAGRSKFLTYGLPLTAVVAVITAVLAINRNLPDRPLLDPVQLPPTQPGAESSTPKAAPPVSKIGITNEVRFIGAVGLVESSSEEISIAPQLTGIVTVVAAKAGDRVKVGDALFQVDPRDGEVAVRQAEANLALARAEGPENARAIEQQKALVEQTYASIDVATAELARSNRDNERASSLVARGAVTVQRFDTSTADAQKAAANVRSARAAVAASQRQVEVLQAQTARIAARIAQAEVQLDKAKLDLANTTTRAPIDGTVLQSRVRLGQVVESRSMDSPLLVLGMTDVLHVRADIDEVDIPRFTPGRSATVSSRGAAFLRVPARYVRTEPLVIPKRSLTGASNERVDTRVLQVIYAIEAPEVRLQPGQQVDVFIEASR